MEQAIKKAIEGGWQPWAVVKLQTGAKWDIWDIHRIYKNTAAFLLEPGFWQAFCADKSGHILKINPIRTIRMWHNFIDHLIEGKDAESFFKELLK